MKKALKIVIPIILIAVVAAVGYLRYERYKESITPNDEIVEFFNKFHTNLVIEDKLIETDNPPKVRDGEILLPIETIREYFDKNIYWDDVLKKVTITTKDRVIRMKTYELEAMINNKPVDLRIAAVEEDGTVYVPIEFLSEFYGIDIKYNEAYDVIIIDPLINMIRIAVPSENDAAVRTGRSIKDPVIRKYDDITTSGSDEFLIDGKLINEDVSLSDLSESAMVVFTEYTDWYLVRTSSGEIGYIRKDQVSVKWITLKRSPDSKAVETEAWKPENGKINLVWEMIYSGRPNLAQIGKIDGLDVISPTWFELKDDQGNVVSRADPVYIDWAHQNGYKIWALFANDFQDINATNSFLNNTDARDNAIRQILSYASLYNLDGINIDFENIYKQDKDALSQFIREITPFLREQGLVVSIDVNIPDGSDTWSLCYDHEALGEIVDYMMLMTYDQHWSSSPVAGSVAQLTWVENNLRKVLDMVPAEKLLLGLPFYTRMWREETDGARVRVTSPSVLTMQGSRNYVKDNDLEVVWDRDSGQFYTEHKDGSVTTKIWIEDHNSINMKSSLALKYRLAGTAAWRRSDETKEVWEILNKNLKVLKSYAMWEENNVISEFQFIR